MLNSIRSRLTLTFIGLVIGPLVVVGGVLAWQSYTVQSEQALTLQHEVAKRVAAQVKDSVLELTHELEVLTKLNNLDDLEYDQLQALLERLQSYQDVFQELALLDSRGRELAHISRLTVHTQDELADRASAEEFTSPAETGKTYYSSVRNDPRNGEPLMTIAVPLKDARTGAVTGVLVADARFLRRIGSLIGSVPVSEGASVYIVDAQAGRVVAHSNPSIVLRETRPTLPEQDGIQSGLSGETSVIAVERLEFGQQQFAIVAEQPVSQALALALNTVRITLGVSLGGLVVAVVLGLVAVRRVVGPIQVLAAVAQAIRAGDLTQQARTVGLKELDELAGSFNSMTAQLRDTLEDLRQQVAVRQQAEVALTEERNLLRTVIDNLPDNVFVKDAQGRFVLDNPAHVRSLGAAARDQVLGKTEADFLPAEAAAQHQADEQALARGEEIIDREEVSLDPAGAPHWFSTTRVPLRDSHGRVVGSVGLSRDITERKRREEVERRLEEHRNSSIGRAEAVAEQLFSRPKTALIELHALTQKAGQDPATAALLDPLPQVLVAQGASLLAGLAEGYAYLFASQLKPELLNVGLRQIIAYLASPEAADVRGVEVALPLYELCQRALGASSISQITQLLAQPQSENAPAEAGPSTEVSRSPVFLQDLSRAFDGLSSAAERLYAYERVDSSSDQLAYLAGAIERLRHTERLARAELGAADRPIVQRLAENWLAIVTGVMGELQTRARITCRLLTRRAWRGDVITLALNLLNEGPGTALNLNVSLAPASEYTLLDEAAQVKRLAAGEETQIELKVRPRLTSDGNRSLLRARFVILYDDARGPSQVEHFADAVDLLNPDEASAFRFIPNPYVVGTPLQTGSPLFFGREDVFAFIQENMAAVQRPNLVLIGQRRTGKTSLLKQLPARLGDAYIPAYVDGQSLALDPGLPSFFYRLATEIAFTLDDRGLAFPAPVFAEFGENPMVAFEHQFLARLRQAIGQRHLLLLLDEFEELEAAARRGHLDPSIFGFLRHLIQHSPGLSVIFCGTHRMEELAADYWSVLFNISLYRHVAFLQQPEALRLIQEPVAAFGMRYDDLALEKMWRVTAGHPYFLQLFCHSLVNAHNRSQRSYVTVADVNTALDDILAAGEAHFVYLWTDSTREERLVLTALSRMTPLTGQATPVLVADFLAERGIQLDRQAVSDALHHLAIRDTLRMSANGDDEADRARGVSYGWRLGLLGLWVEKYKSLHRVVDENLSPANR